MINDGAIEVENLYKKFTKNLKLSMFYGLHDMFKDWRGVSDESGGLRNSEFWALKDINFRLKRGQTLGIIGRNGSGKTTLLRMLNGIYPPDRGRIEICGKVSALISSGMGFHRHFTGRQNIFVGGAVRGLSQKEIRSRMDSIIDFAEIGDFIDAPVATYSKGMLMRLGFSIAVHCPIEILLIDEVIAVGDLKFRVKCYEKLAELKEQGVTTLLVSHIMAWISAYSDSVLLLDKGNVVHCGDVKTGVGIYMKDVADADKQKNKKKEFEDLEEEESEILKLVTGNEEFKVEGVQFTPEIINGLISMKTGEDLTVAIDYTANRDFPDIDINSIISPPGKSERHILCCTNRAINKRIDIKRGNGRLLIVVRNINLTNYKAHCQFSVSVDRKTHVFWWRQIPLYVEGNALSAGFIHYEIDYEVKENEATIL